MSLRVAIFAGAAALLSGVALSGPSVAAEEPAELLEACQGLGRDDAVENEAARRVAASDCALSTERRLGPDDRRLVAFYSGLADRLAAGRGGAAAQSALPYRRRAHRAAGRLFGADTEPAGRAALSYARASILAGRCEAHDPEVIGLLEAAAEGMRGAERPAARTEGLRAVAFGFADGLAYARAASAMLEAGGPDQAALRPQDWERIGVWRHRLGDAAGAEQAYRAALAKGPAPRDAMRLRQSLKQVLFEQGDFDALRALEAE